MALIDTPYCYGVKDADPPVYYPTSSLDGALDAARELAEDRGRAVDVNEFRSYCVGKLVCTVPAPMTDGQVEKIRRVKAQAEAAHAQYPQYAGYWDGPEWMPVRVTKRVFGHGAESFQEDDITLARPVDAQEIKGGLDGCVVAYSFRTDRNTVINRGKVVFL